MKNKIINFDNEPQEKLSQEWWDWYENLSCGCRCIIKNTRTKKIYVGWLCDIYPFENKAQFFLEYDLNTKERKKRHIKINFNNLGYHKIINFFY